MLSDAITNQLVIEATPERVWSVLTDPAFLGSWFGDGEPATPVELDLRPGGPFLLPHHDHGQVSARFERTEPPHHLSWRWSRGPATQIPAEHNSTLVEFTLAPFAGRAGCTRLTVMETGFIRLAVPFDEADARRQATARSWPPKLAHLHRTCEAPPAITPH
ncbi:hypothetical protein CFP65_1566 [Kitasatospora sp. MMS16-BH015]|uniref:SRPBCC domain-containing protein n=1 Tax=Kitasatospora sp. MMS16-BH015 TaxID=2018025 RepID=UPI000CA214A3|nr:SRPBCC domain-containing protein [Kitasatospora sp. MMS16-BH015]AUG76454.1 hypothetical protein CFP65_1566 [Kitasatospora sp. MMS16-BH015]